MPVKSRAILIVEDEFFLADDLAKAFKAAGALVLGPVRTAKEADDIVGSGARVDGAVLDINLRGNLAFEVADTLMARDIPFAFATGYDTNVIPAKYQNVARWEKPADAKLIVEQMGAMLDNRA